MALDIKKPAPMQVGNRYLYSLNSYDPIELELFVPYVSDYEVDLTCASIIGQVHTEGEEITDAWIAEHIEGVETLEEFHAKVRQDLAQMNAVHLEEQKQGLALGILAERLVQAVPDSEVNLMLNALKGNMMQQGITEEQLAASFGGSLEMANQMLRGQAMMACEQRAALDAFATHLELEVDEEDMPALLGLEEEEATNFIAQAKLAGTLDQLKQNLLRNSAAQVVIENAHVNYVHETKEEAEARLAASLGAQMPNTPLS